MKRRHLLTGIGALALGALGLGAAAARSGANPYYSGPVTDHFNGTHFFNPNGVPPGRFTDLLKWQFSGERAEWPKQFPSPYEQAKPEKLINGERIKVTMVGHATVLIQIAGLNLLTDPVWSERASPVSFAGPKRVNSPGIAFEDLPPIDAVLLSHNHYDHLDLATLSRLVRVYDPPIITPLGNDAIVRQEIPRARFETRDWGESVSLGQANIHLTPVHHWSARGMRDRRMALWAGFVIETPAGKIYHVGDTGFHEGINFVQAAQDHGPFRLAILPVGAYEPRWFMKGQHMNPDEAVRGKLACNAGFAVGHHWGTFQLTDEAIEAPIQALAKALVEHGVDPARFPALRPGQAVEVPPLPAA